MNEPDTLAVTLVSGFEDFELDLLREDPVDAIPLLAPEVTVEITSFSASGSCSVEGLYQEQTRVISVQPAMSGRRTKFTMLHEFAHYDMTGPATTWSSPVDWHEAQSSLGGGLKRRSLMRSQPEFSFPTWPLTKFSNHGNRRLTM